MKLRIFLGCLIPAFLAFFSVHAAGATPNKGDALVDAGSVSRTSGTRQGLTIHVVSGDWGDASTEDIEKLLYETAGELWRYFPERSLKPIIVAPSPYGPLVKNARGPRGEYVVYLSSKDRRWSQFAYQFAHEFAHILTNYDRLGAASVRHNQWFDESLCEAAALFTLRRLSMSWQQDGRVPYPNWKSYAVAFDSYAQHLLKQPHRQLPPEISFAQWYEDHREALRNNPYIRAKDGLVANMLLPLFENDPETWAAIGYLNLDESDATNTLKDFLENWSRNAPERHKPVVESIMTLFGLGERATVTAARN